MLQSGNHVEVTRRESATLPRERHPENDVGGDVRDHEKAPGLADLPDLADDGHGFLLSYTEV